MLNQMCAMATNGTRLEDGSQQQPQSLWSSLVALVVPVLVSTVLREASLLHRGYVLMTWIVKMARGETLTRSVERVECFDRYGYEVHAETDDDDENCILQKAIRAHAAESKTLSAERNAHLSLCRSEASSLAGGGARELRTLELQTCAPPGEWVRASPRVEMLVTRKTMGPDAAKRTKVRTIVELRSRDKGAATAFAKDALDAYRRRQRRRVDDARRYMLSPLAKCEQWKQYALSDDKDLSTLFFATKSKLLRALDDFDAGRRRKLGLLLHGPPGTGKTSLIKALAVRLRRHVINLPLSRLGSDARLASAVRDCRFAVGDTVLKLEPAECIFVMEDVDAASDLVLANHSEDPAKALTLVGLAEILDGLVDLPGRVLVLTTNYPKRLHPTLIRPGRVSLRLYLGYVDRDAATQMAAHYFAHPESRQEDLDAVADAVDHLRRAGRNVTPAQLEHLCASYDSLLKLADGLRLLIAARCG